MKHQIQIYLLSFISMLVFLGTSAIAKPDADYSDYMQDIQYQIKHNWHPPTMKQSTRAVVFFKISKNGKILDARIDKPSLFKEIDQSVLKAVNGADPLPPPPGSQELSIQFTFDYNVTDWKMPGAADLSKTLHEVHLETLGFLLGALLIVSLIIYKLISLGRPPRGSDSGPLS